MAPQNENLQKICVPGVTVIDLCHWLSRAPASHTISHVTLHVGVNSCPSGPVSEAAWSDLIAMCRKVFPQASLRLSSIIPARGRNNLNNAIVPSNRHLQTACSEAGVEFVDNQSTFTAESGAPRLSLYKDIIHPSAKGTARLAANLRYTDSSEHPCTPRDGHNFHFQRLRTDHSVLQKRNAYEQEQDGHDFQRQQADRNVQRHDFQWDNQDPQQRRDNGSYQHRHADYQRRPGHLHRSQNYPYRSWHHHSDQRSYEYANNSGIPPPNSHYHYPALVSKPGPIIPPPSQFCPLPNTAPERTHLDRDGTSTALRHPAVSSHPPD